MWSVMYGDDISLVCTDVSILRTPVSIVDNISISWELTIADSIQKTKCWRWAEILRL